MCDMCDKGEDGFMESLLETIGTCGHAIIYVDPGEGREQYMSYTVGLTGDADHGYELAQSGLSPEQSHVLLNTLPEILVKRGIKPIEGLVIEGVLTNSLHIRLREASKREEFSVIARVYGQTSIVWQALWPDPDNKFPGEIGYNMPNGHLQELL